MSSPNSKKEKLNSEETRRRKGCSPSLSNWNRGCRAHAADIKDVIRDDWTINVDILATRKVSVVEANYQTRSQQKSFKYRG